MNYLTEEEVQEILKLNSNKTKALFRTEGFPSFKIGKEYRVEEEKLIEYLNTIKKVKLDYSKV